MTTTPYQQARLEIRDGDLLAWRNGGIIARVSDGEYTHVGLALWVKQALFIAESREWYGGRIVTLSSQVRKYPGACDVYRPRGPAFMSSRAAEFCARQAGHEYGWSNIKLAALKRMTLWRLLTGWKPPAENSKWYEPKDCSCTVVWSYRKAAGGSESICGTVPDRQCEPNDVVNCGFFGEVPVFAGLTHEVAA